METTQLTRKEADILRIHDVNKEIIRIAPDGNVYWNGRLVESDDNFKAAMLDLVAALKGK